MHCTMILQSSYPGVTTERTDLHRTQIPYSWYTRYHTQQRARTRVYKRGSSVASPLLYTILPPHHTQDACRDIPCARWVQSPTCTYHVSYHDVHGALMRQTHLRGALPGLLSGTILEMQLVCGMHGSRHVWYTGGPVYVPKEMWCNIHIHMHSGVLYVCCIHYYG